MSALLLLLALLMAADVAQTGFFSRFGLVEGNKFLARLMGQHGFDELVLVKYLVFAGVFVAAGQGWIGTTELLVAIALQGGVVAWNAYKMWRNA